MAEFNQYRNYENYVVFKMRSPINFKILSYIFVIYIDSFKIKMYKMYKMYTAFQILFANVRCYIAEILA